MGHCPLSSNQLYIHSSGEVYTCSFLQNKPEHILGHIGKQSLREIWNSKPRSDFAQTHSSDNLMDFCKKYQADYSCHKTGNRTYFNKDGTLKRLDIMLDSACNLKCIMCTNIYDRTGGLKDNYFWENNDDTFKSIQEIELVGGEPVISPYFFKIIDQVYKLNPDCRWFMTTNAHYDLTSEIIERLQKAKFDSISISLDSLKKDVFEKIRVRSHFEKVYQNIFRLKKILPRVQINTVIQLDNYEELISLYEWCQKEEFHFYPILLQYPDTFSLKHLDSHLKKNWIIEVMQKNESFKSPELVFFVKKLLAIDPIRNDPEVRMNYLRQLEIMGEVNE